MISAGASLKIIRGIPLRRGRVRRRILPIREYIARIEVCHDPPGKLRSGAEILGSTTGTPPENVAEMPFDISARGI